MESQARGPWDGSARSRASAPQQLRCPQPLLWRAVAEGLAVQRLLLALICLLTVCPPWAGAGGQVLGLTQAARCSFLSG